MQINSEAPADRPVIIMSRTFDAPREKVWEALTRPEHVARWYGGHGFENPVCEMDVRPGGEWRHVMRTPDGNEYKLHFVFVEVKRPERLVWQDAELTDAPVHGKITSRIEVTLTDRGQQTDWTMVATFPSLEARDAARAMGFEHILAEGAEKMNAVASAME